MTLLRIATLHDEDTVLSVPAGANLLEALRGHPRGHPPAPCGGRGTCFKCRVRLLDDLHPFPPCAADRRAFSPAELAEGWRLACRIQIPEVPQLRLAQPGHRAAESCETGLSGRAPQRRHSLRRVTVQTALPSLDDQRSDDERLLGALAAAGEKTEADLPPAVLRRLPGLLRAHGFRCSAVFCGERIIDVRPPEEGRLIGAAVDLGTTTVALVLYNLETGDALHLGGAGNRQSEFGDDVISRISAAARPGGLSRLQEAARATIRELLLAGCAHSGIAPRDIAALVVAGNTTMQHLLAGVSPEGIGCSPFLPVFSAGQRRTMRELLPAPDDVPAADGWPDDAPAYLLPSLGAYVGGDITAGILTQLLPARPGNRLLIDAGTNGEIVLQAEGKLYACSTAAGPAFEGARIAQGMRACGGAISRVVLSAAPAQPGQTWPEDADLQVTTIHEEPAVGLCGSGLLDAVAALLAAGLLDETGALTDPDDLPDDFPPRLLARLTEEAVILAPGVLLTQKDVREFQLACAAIQAGARVLLAEAGIEAEQLDEVLLAGGFGNRLDPQSARRTGLIPAEVPAERVRGVGNSSLAGARLCLLEEQARQEAEEVRKSVVCLELSGRADFQEFYVEAMEFPEL